MQQKKRHLQTSGQIILLLLLITSASIMIYRFFKADLIRDNYREVQRLESVVLRTYAREYQRIILLIQSVQHLDSSTNEQLEISLDSLLEGYGPEGQIPFLIKSASFSLSEDPLKEGEFQIQNTRLKENGALQTMMLHTPLGRDDLLIRLELDKEGLDRYYIEPAVEESLPGYTLEWISLDPKQRGEPPLKESILFQPLAALIGWSHNAEADLMIPLPEEFNNHRTFIPGKREIPREEEMTPDTKNKNERDRFFTLRPDMNPFRKSNRFLIIGFEQAPYYAEIEKKTALSWLLANLVLLGAGLIFLLLILQMKRLKTLRSREKEFVASMTHELRTPLTVIQSAADNLSEGIIAPEKVTRYGRVMKDQVNRLSAMIEEILLFSSLEGNQPKPETQVDIHMAELVEELKKSIGPLAEEKNINLLWDAEGFPEEVTGYPGETRLVLSNLISNAVTHAYPDTVGPVRILIRYNISEVLRITVADEGQGISPGEQKMIFDPFYRTHFSREKQTRGSGLGLFIARKKALFLGGSLRLESPYKSLNGEKQRGCRFILEIPCSCGKREKI